jgi:hypothetical protein
MAAKKAEVPTTASHYLRPPLLHAAKAPIATKAGAKIQTGKKAAVMVAAVKK